MKNLFIGVILTCFLAAFWLVSLVTLGDHPRVKQLKPQVRALLGKEKIYTSQQNPITLKDQDSYLAGLRNKYADHPPVPNMVAIPAGVLYPATTAYPVPDKSLTGVVIDQFEMATTETTVEQWDTCVAFGGCSHLPDNYAWGRGELPVLNVSFYDALQYIKWLNSQTKGGYRLPQNAEWEYAARAGSHSLYPWGDTVKDCQQARLGSSIWAPKEEIECKIKGTFPVGQTEPNAWGLYDVIGNVAEWTTACSEKIGQTKVGLIPPKALKRIKEFIRTDCSSRINRGGNLMTSGKTVNVFHSRAYSAKLRYNRVGFRLARTIPPVVTQ